MKNNSDITNDTDAYDDQNNELVPSRQIQFWTILIFEIPSLACTIYLLYHLLVDKRLRKALHNHVIIILLILCFIIEVIDNPLYLDAFLHGGRSSFHSFPMICLIWMFIDYGVYGAIVVFFAWASFERHILIFYHHQLLGTKLKRLFFHFIPLGVLSIYLIGFYIGVIFFPPCKNIFDYELEVCGAPCYEQVSWLTIWDYLIHGTMCTLIEAVCSISLLIRVIWQKHRVHQRIHWRKHRKMTIQLLSISALSLSIILPQNLLTFIQQMIPGLNDFGSQVELYFFYLTTFVILFLPFVALGSLPEVWPKFISFKKRRQRIVAPFKITAATRRSIAVRARPIFK